VEKFFQRLINTIIGIVMILEDISDNLYAKLPRLFSKISAAY
jgi:hypothetical protein